MLFYQEISDWFSFANSPQTLTNDPSAYAQGGSI